MSLSFLFDLAKNYEPWELSRVVFEKKHLFYEALRGKKSQSYDFSPIIADVKKFDIARWKGVIDALPTSWILRRDKVCSHMLSIKTNLDKLDEELRKSLA